MAAKRQRKEGTTDDGSFASELNRRMVEARAGVVELADAARLSKETIRRLRLGLAEPSEVTRRKLDDGFDLLAARRQATVASVVVTQDEFDEFRQRVGYASSVAGANARGIAEGHEKLDRIEQALADVLATQATIRGELAVLRDLAGRVFDSAPWLPSSR